MKFAEVKAELIKGPLETQPNARYDVVVGSKIGRYADYKNLAYYDAKQQLNRLVGDYQSDIFKHDSQATVEWKNEGNAAVITQTTGNRLFFYLMKVDKV